MFKKFIPPKISFMRLVSYNGPMLVRVGEMLPHHKFDLSFSSLHQWFPLVQISLLGYNTLYAKIGFSMAKETLEFNSICNKVFNLVWG